MQTERPTDEMTQRQAVAALDAVNAGKLRVGGRLRETLIDLVNESSDSADAVSV